jgi:ATP-dependent Clp protease adapter protein ClpS
MTKILDRPKEGMKIVGINMASLTERWAVEALNNDTTSFQDVMKVMVNVCGHSAHDAKCYTLKIHTEGRAVCFWGSKETCEGVITAFTQIRVGCNLIEA